MQLACQPEALIFLRLQDLAGKLLHLFSITFQLAQHLVESVGQPIKAFVAVIAQQHTRVDTAAAHVVHCLLQPIQRIQGTL